MLQDCQNLDLPDEKGNGHFFIIFFKTCYKGWKKLMQSDQSKSNLLFLNLA